MVAPSRSFGVHASGRLRRRRLPSWGWGGVGRPSAASCPTGTVDGARTELSIRVVDLDGRRVAAHGWVTLSSTSVGGGVLVMNDAVDVDLDGILGGRGDDIGEVRIEYVPQLAGPVDLATVAGAVDAANGSDSGVWGQGPVATAVGVSGM